MKNFEIIFGDLTPKKQDELLKETISKIKEKYDVDISHAYDYTFDGVKIRMIDKDDNVNIRFISYHDLCINAVNYFEHRLEEMAKQLLRKDKEEDKYYGKHTSKCMAIVEFNDHHYERVDQVYNSRSTFSRDTP